MASSDVKSLLYKKCSEWLDEKIAIATKAMKDAQESANSEEKSSAGDKYETGRAMSQNERDMYARQLAECLKQKEILSSTDITTKSEKIIPGSLVITSVASYFICISAGVMNLENQQYFVVSPETPVARLLLNKKAGEFFSMNGKEIQIKSIS